MLRYHLGTDAHVFGQDGVWRHGVVPPLAAERTVAVLGLGEYRAGGGGDAAWPRVRRGGLEPAGQRAGRGADLCRRGRPRRGAGRREILVTLLPATPDTDGLIDARRLAMLPEGARLINPGRGGLIDDAALLAALDRGHLAHATLDVFREEPLPAAHPFWAHPRITVTPHVAAATRPETAAETVADNVRRGEAGLPFRYVVDRAAGY